MSENKDFRKEYNIVLKDRDQILLRHDEEHKAWNEERKNLQDTIERLRSPKEGDEYLFRGEYVRPGKKPLKIVAVVMPGNLDDFINGSAHTDGKVSVIDSHEGGSFWADKDLIAWSYIEVHKKD